MREFGLDRSKEAGFFLGARFGDDRQVFLRPRTQVQQQRGIAAVVEDHVGKTAIGPVKNAVGVIPVILERFALDGENRDVLRSNRRGGVILRRENVARGPAYLGTQGSQRFDQYRRLDGHVQAAGNARALQGLAFGEFLADGHETGHFGFGNANFLAAPIGEGKVGNNVISEFFCHNKAPWCGRAAGHDRTLFSSAFPHPARVGG